MKRLLLILVCAVMASASFAQNTRVVKGVVFDNEDIPMAGATITVAGMSETALTGANGNFEIYVSPYAKRVTIVAEGFISQSAEIDGSYLVFKLKVDKEYAKRKAQEAEAARIATEQAKAAEEARIAAEKAKAEEEARIAAEKAKAEEEARIAAEKAKAKEEARIAAEKAKAEEKARRAAEREAAKQVSAAAKETSAAAKESTPKQVKEPKVRKPAAAPVKRFASAIEFNHINDGHFQPIGLNYIGGLQKSSWFFGGGAGIYHGYFWNNYPSPGSFDWYNIQVQRNVDLREWSGRNIYGSVFAHVKKSFDLGIIQPFVAVSAGLSLSFFQEFATELSYAGDTGCMGYYESHYDTCESKPFIDPQVGIILPLRNNMGLYFSIGYRFDDSRCTNTSFSLSNSCAGHGINDCDIHPIVSDYINAFEHNHSGLDLHIGFTF